MKAIIYALSFLLSVQIFGQSSPGQNIFITTTDGFRWQEIFNGADSGIINDPSFVMNPGLIKALYWDTSIENRRKKLMPFFWNVIQKQGQLYGNRAFDNKVNVKNIYKISYPGYNELLTGFSDPFPIFNTPTFNKNISILEYLNQQQPYKDKIVAFCSWYIFPFLLNAHRNNMLINSGYTSMMVKQTENAQNIDTVQGLIDKGSHTRYDLLTYMTAMEYIQTQHPKVVYISLGETDEFAHQGLYDRYLQQANNIDKMIGDLWYYLQTDPFYKNNTSLLITTDHGRGEKHKKWKSHNGLIKGSGQIWLALLGKGIEGSGEMKSEQKIFQNQLAATIASLLGYDFDVNKNTGKPILLPHPNPLSELIESISIRQF